MEISFSQSKRKRELKKNKSSIEEICRQKGDKGSQTLGAYSRDRWHENCVNLFSIGYAPIQYSNAMFDWSRLSHDVIGPWDNLMTYHFFFKCGCIILFINQKSSGGHCYLNKIRPLHDAFRDSCCCSNAFLTLFWE